MYGEPWKNTAQSALRFAFGMLASAEALPNLLATVMGGPGKSRTELEIIELRAQAAVIRGMIETLQNQIAASYLIAYYLPKPMWERQAGGGVQMVDRFSVERRDRARIVAKALLGTQGSGVYRIRGYEEMVAQFCLGARFMDEARKHGWRNMGFERLRALLKIDASKVAEVRGKCQLQLLDLDTKAHALADNKLYEKGLIGEETYVPSAA